VLVSYTFEIRSDVSMLCLLSVSESMLHTYCKIHQTVPGVKLLQYLLLPNGTSAVFLGKNKRFY